MSITNEMLAGMGTPEERLKFAEKYLKVLGVLDRERYEDEIQKRAHISHVRRVAGQTNKNLNPIRVGSESPHKEGQ